MSRVLPLLLAALGIVVSAAAQSSETRQTGQPEARPTASAVMAATAGCTYSVTPTVATFPATNVAPTFVFVTASLSDCPWTVTTDAPWVFLSPVDPRVGVGSFHYAIADNPSPNPRTATMTIAGIAVTIKQAGTSQQYISLITNSGSDNVTIAGLNAETFLSLFPAGGTDPRGVVFSPDGRYAYVADTGSNTVGYITPFSPTIIPSTVSVGSHPTQLAISPDGRSLYVSNNGSNSITVLLVPALTVLATIPVGASPEGIAVSPDGKRVYVVCSSANAVYVLDTATQLVTGTIPVGSGPFGIVLSPSGQKAYVTNRTDGTVSVLDLTSNTVTATITVGIQPEGIAVLPNGAFVYAANSGSDSVSVIDAVTNSVATSISMPTPRGLAVTPDGYRLVVTSPSFNTALEFDTSNYYGLGQIYLGTGTLPHSNPAIGPCTIASFQPVLTMLATGGTANFPVSSYCPWTPVSNSSFLTITNTAGTSGNGSVTFTADPNPTTSPRTGTITVNNQIVTVVQNAFVPAITISPGSASFLPAGGTGTVTVRANSPAVTYTAASSAPWLTITSGATGTGGGTVSYTVAPSSTGDTRTATITINDQVFTVVQGLPPCTYLVSGYSATPIADGTTIRYGVTTGPDCAWTSSATASWIHVKRPAGSGSGFADFVVDPNPSVAPRTGSIAFAGQTFQVNQLGYVCKFQLSPPVTTFSAAGGTGKITLQTGAGCVWSTYTTANWLHFATLNGTGPATVSFQVDANTTAVARETYAQLGTGNDAVLINQTGTAASSTSLTTTAAVPLYNNYTAYTLNLGQLNTLTQTITLSYGQGAGNFSVSTAGSPNFLSVLQSNGPTTAVINLTINPAGLLPGAYVNTASFTVGGSITTYTVMLTVQGLSSNLAKVGVYRDSAGLILLDKNGDGTCCGADVVGNIGQAGDIPLAGDWGGTGVRMFGLYRPATGLFLLDEFGSGAYNPDFDGVFTFAPQAGDIPVVGDWLGRGRESVGIFRPSTGTWFLDTQGNGSFQGRAYLGQAGDIPIVGNWNGVGTQTKVGIYRPASVNGQPGNFFLVDTNGDGQYTSADQPLFFLGQPGDTPIAGDWNGDGKTKVGVFRPGNGLLILDQDGSFSWDGPGTDRVLFFAPSLNGAGNTTAILPGDVPVTGDWAPSYGASNTVQLQGRTRTGIYRPGTGTFFLDVSGDGTYQGRAYFGQSGDVPVGLPVMVGGKVIGVNGLGNF